MFLIGAASQLRRGAQLPADALPPGRHPVSHQHRHPAACRASASQALNLAISATAGEAATGAEAVRAAAALQPDLVLMDLQMPEGNGIEATRAIVAAAPHIRAQAMAMARQAGLGKSAS